MSLPTTRLSKCPMKLLGIASAGSASYSLLVAANFRPCPVFSTGFVFWYGDILTFPVFFCVFKTRYLPGRYLVRLKHKDQTPICRKCSRPGHQTRTWPDTFCFNCEELGHMIDSCPEEIHCCIFRVTSWLFVLRHGVTFLSLVNIRVLFCIFLSFRIFWWELSSSVFTAVFAAFWSTITQFPEFL